MKMKVFGIVLAALAAVSCSQNPQVVLLKGGQSLTQLLRTAQTAENTVCLVDPTKATHCTATIPGVTAAQLDSIHQRFEGAMVKAFTDKLVYDKEAAAWQPGQGSPVSLLSLQADVNLAFKVIQEIGTSPAVSNVLKTVQDVINTVVSLVASSAGKAPQPVVVAVDDPCAREYPHVAMLCRAYRSITQR